MTSSLPKARYETDEKIANFNDRLVERIRALPGVEAAALGLNVPFDDNEWDDSFHITGTPPYAPGEAPEAEVNVVTADYFRVMRMPLLRGRAFAAEDRASQPRSVIIDESLAQKYFPGKDPIGRQIDDNQSDEKNPPPLTIVGVVSRTRSEAAGEDNVEQYHWPQMTFAAEQVPKRSNVLVVRVKSGSPLALVPAIKRELAGARSRSGFCRHFDHGKQHREESRFASHDDVAARRVCGNRAAACERRTLRRDGPDRNAADP